MRSRRSRGTWIRRPACASGGQFRLQNGGGPRQRLGARVQLGQVQAPLRQRRTAQQQAAFLGQVFGHSRPRAGRPATCRPPACAPRPPGAARRCRPPRAPARLRDPSATAWTGRPPPGPAPRRRKYAWPRPCPAPDRRTGAAAAAFRAIPSASHPAQRPDRTARPAVAADGQASENPPSAKRTVLPAWTRRSRASLRASTAC